jgi:hypothetical protein
MCSFRGLKRSCLRGRIVKKGVWWRRQLTDQVSESLECVHLPDRFGSVSYPHDQLVSGG